MAIGVALRYFAVCSLLALVTLAADGPHAEATFEGGNGSVAYAVPLAGGPGVDLWMADEGGANPRKVYDSIGIFETWGPAFSPGGGTVAYGLLNTFASETIFINIFDTAGAELAPCGGNSPDPLCDGATLASFPRLLGGDTSRPDYLQPPAWSPDGSQLAVAAADGIWVINVNQARGCADIPCQEAARTKVLNNTASIKYDQPNWQPGGSLIAVRVYEKGTGNFAFLYDIGTFPVTGGQVMRLNVWRNEPGSVDNNMCHAGMPNWSPNGQQIAYETGECLAQVTTTFVLPPFGPITYQLIPASAIAIVTPGGPWHRITPLSESNAYSFTGQTDPVWAPDMSQMAYYGNCQKTGSPVKGICAVSLDGEGREYWGALGRFPDWSTGDGTMPDATFDAHRTAGGGLINVHRGDQIEYNGEGWDLNGPDFTIKWNGEQVATNSAASAFAGSFTAPDFPEFDSRLASLGQTTCRTDITAEQGGTRRTVHVQGEPAEVVYKASGAVTRGDGKTVSFGQSISCEGGVFLAEGDVPLTLGSIGDNACEDPDLQSQFTLVTSSISGRAKEGALDQVEPYPGLWVQYIGPHGECIDANGIFADQLWIGSQLVARGHALGSSPDLLAKIDLSTGAYTRRQPASGVSLNAHIVQFLLTQPPPNDLNQNGVDDELEISPDAFKREFSDLQISGSTNGKIVIEGSVAFTVVRDLNTNTLDIAASGTPFDVQTGEENAAELVICEQKLRIVAPGRIQFRCDSLSSSVIEGRLEVFMGVNTAALLPAGSDTTISKGAGDDYIVANNAGSQADVLLLAEGALTTVTPGKSDVATVVALKGDVNCGGTVDTLDSIDLMRILAGLSIEASSCPATALAQRDIDCIGGVAVKDALRLIQFAADIAVALDAGCAPIGTFPPAP